MEEKVSYSGITFIDIDKRDDNWSFPDYECKRVPIKGEVVQFNHYADNINSLYYGEVLYVIDTRSMWGAERMQDCAVKTHSITVILKEIKGKWGDDTYNTLLDALTYRNKKKL